LIRAGDDLQRARARLAIALLGRAASLDLLHLPTALDMHQLTQIA
jgi:hypothetical protein